MNAFAHLATTQPVVFVHVLSMLGATALGGWLLAGRKGRTAHRLGGWVWVVLMASAALSSVFIPSVLPNIAGIGPIHLLTLLVLVMLPTAVRFARTHRVQAHRQAMTQLYVGACVTAGVFTLLPGRFFGQMLWG